MKILLIICFTIVSGCLEAFSQADLNSWYTEGNYSPSTRIRVEIHNPLDMERDDCPITVQREELPFWDFGPRELVVVDPSLPARGEPTKEEKLMFGGHLTLGEENGVSIQYQLDDLDRDGIWDELFFMVDLKPKETKTIFLYLGYNNRGMYVHSTFAAVGDYGRHPVPMWESELLTWKLWYPTDVDIQVKRQRMLNGYYSLVNNMSGYHFSYDKGTDIMTVGSTFGAGGIGLFELPREDSVSRPRFSPYHNSGPTENTRYLHEVVSSGPIRSIVRVSTKNWRSGQGEYELEQYYVAYKNKYYSTCKVLFTKWLPQNKDTHFAVGIRQIMHETEQYINNGIVVSIAKDMPVIDPNPETMDRYRGTLDYAATALVVKEEYKPVYQYVSVFEGNHTFRIPSTHNKTFEYLLTAGWHDAPEYRTIDDFKQFVLETSQEYNHPAELSEFVLEKKREDDKPIEYWTPPTG